MRKLILSTFILFTTLPAFSQGGIPMKTGHRDVTAVVDPGSGWVQVKRFPGNIMDGTLSFYQKSFVSFSVNGKVFTNNDVGLPTPLTANTSILKNGILQRIGDTIRCTWANKDNVDLIQEVYPVLFDKSEQIVLRWKAMNNTGSPVNIAVQYLLDVQVGDGKYTNDGAAILTRNGYSPQWRSYDGSDSNSIPAYYMAFQYPLPHAPSFDPGLDGTGYTDNSYHNLGLTKPIRLTVGDWTKLIAERWGPPSPIPTGHYTDASILLEYPESIVQTGTESDVALTSYGTGEFATCKGQIFGVVMFPGRIEWTPPDLTPNPFTVEFHAFNPHESAPAPQTTLTLTVGQDLTITGPLPIDNNGKSQTQFVGNGGMIVPLGVGVASWTVQATKETQCFTDIISSLKFTGASPGLGYPIFINDANGSDTCEHAIVIECASLNSVASNGADEAIFRILGNPASDKATIQLTLERIQDVKLRIVDVVGKEVRTLDAKGLSQGENLIPLQTSELASGTYYIIVEIDGKQFAKSLRVIR